MKEILRGIESPQDLKQLSMKDLSHLAKEADVKHALNEINALDVVSSEAVLIRIENEELD